MFSQDRGSNVHLRERAVAAFGVLLELLERGQKEGALRKRPVRGQAAASWAQVHGITMLTVDGLFDPERVGGNALDVALATLFEGLSV